MQGALADLFSPPPLIIAGIAADAVSEPPALDDRSDRDGECGATSDILAVRAAERQKKVSAAGESLNPAREGLEGGELQPNPGRV